MTDESRQQQFLMLETARRKLRAHKVCGPLTRGGSRPTTMGFDEHVIDIHLSSTACGKEVNAKYHQKYVGHMLCYTLIYLSRCLLVALRQKLELCK